MSESLTNYFERLDHHQKAEKALKVAKEIEAQKLRDGKSYLRIDRKTWVLK